jgi:SPX domain protein involved in polyphosphate accumulation
MYDLSIFHDGEEIGQVSDVSVDTGFSMVKFDVPDDVSGVMTLQFENLNGSDLADAIFTVVVDRVNIDETSIPAWIKNNAGWWATDQIDDSAFLQGIQYLIQEGIMIIPHTESSDDSDAIPDAGQRAQAFDQRVPAWIKNNAGWWATDQIDDSSFLQGIQYLVQKGIIVV